MIDFIKILILCNNLINIIWDNPLLTFRANGERLATNTGEIIGREIRCYKNLVFTRYVNKLEITGSLHYYFNDGLHNANDFRAIDCINTIKSLESTFNLSLDKCIIINLEYGLNIPLPFSVKKTVQSLKYHERNEFRNTKGLRYAKESSSFTREGRVNMYKLIKAYAKGLQLFDGKQMADENTFRLEVKSKVSKYFNKLLSIYTVQDLLNPLLYKQLGNELLKEWDNVLLVDKITDFSNDKRVLKYIDTDLWEEIIQDDRHKFSRYKKRYFELLAKYPNNIHATIKNMIVCKVNELTKSVTISTATSIKEVLQYLQYVCVDNVTVWQNTCTVTGIPKKSTKKYLTPIDIQYYYDNIPMVYNWLINEFNTTSYKNIDYSKLPLEKRFVEISHRVRAVDFNSRNNTRNNTKRAIDKVMNEPTLSLFNQWELISDNKKQLAGYSI